MPRPKTKTNRFSLSSFKERVFGVAPRFRRDFLPGIKTSIKKHPMVSFFVALAVLFALIVANSLLTSTPETPGKEEAPREVEVYTIGNAPKISVSGKVEKEGVVTLVAQSPGIINSVNVAVGDNVSRGTVIIGMANDYTGGNTATVQRQLAGVQYKNIKETYGTQLDIIGKQKQLASENRENTEALQGITDQSVSETQNLITLNASVIVSLEENLAALEASNVGGANDEAILSTRSLLVQSRSANNQLYQALRNAEYQSGEDNPPAAMAALSEDIALKQLDLQEKALKLSLETAGLQARLAQIGESIMFPQAPFDGVVERINVVPGQYVAPGTPLATIASGEQTASIVAQVPSHIAERISSLEPSALFISGKTYEVVPQYVSQEATDGLLYSVIYEVPEDLVNKITARDFIQVDIPIGYPDAISTIPYLPIDIIFETQSGSFVYVIENGKAVSRKVVLGNVVGGNVAVESGLAAEDQVILDRNIIEGDRVVAAN